jgi:hypothetical protein
MEQLNRDKQFLMQLGQHLVALCGSYVKLNENGEPSGPPAFYSYTGTVLEINGKWCIATAGHCLKHLESAIDHPKVRVEAQVLADYFGPNSTNQNPLPFKPLEQESLYVDDDGLDFGLVYINELWKKNLARNGIVPFSSKQWNFPDDLKFESYAIVGFPDEFTGGSASQNDRSMVGHLMPSYIPLCRHPDDTSETYQQFRAEIVDRGDQKSIVGMSGGPIFGFFREDGEVKYLLVALQSWWDKKRTVFGCLTKKMMEFVELKIRERLAERESRRDATQ